MYTMESGLGLLMAVDLSIVVGIRGSLMKLESAPELMNGIVVCGTISPAHGRLASSVKNHRSTLKLFVGLLQCLNI